MVAMQNPARVRGAQTVGYHHQHFHDLPPGALVFASWGSGPVFERAAVDVFRNQVLLAFDLTRIVDRKDLRVIQRGRHLRFALEPPAGRDVG